MIGITPEVELLRKGVSSAGLEDLWVLVNVVQLNGVDKDNAGAGIAENRDIFDRVWLRNGKWTECACLAAA